MDAIVAFKNKVGGTVQVAVVAKFCGGNGGCTLSDAANNASAYTQAFKQSIPVHFLEYKMPLNTVVDNIRGDVNNASVLASDSVSGGVQLGKVMTRGLGYDLLGRKIVVLMGTYGHKPCDDMIEGFKASLDEERRKTGGVVGCPPGLAQQHPG